MTYPVIQQKTALPSSPKRQVLAWGYWLSLPFLLFVVIPLVALVLHVDLSHFLVHLSAPYVLDALRLSLATTLFSTALIFAIGTPVAYLLANRRDNFTRVIDVLVDLPTVLPPAVSGVALLMAFGRRGLLGGVLGELGVQLAFTPTAVVIAQIFVASPFYIKAAALGFLGVGDEVKHAASIDGANNWQIFAYMVVPLAWRAILTGVVASWARALGEFGATILFAGNFPGKTQTMPLAIYLGFESSLDVVVTLSVVLLLLSFCSLFLVKRLLGG